MVYNLDKIYLNQDKGHVFWYWLNPSLQKYEGHRINNNEFKCFDFQS